MHRTAIPVLLAMVTGIPIRSAAAQRPAERAELERLQVSLAASVNPRPELPEVPAGNAPLELLWKGIVALRVAELTSGREAPDRAHALLSGAVFRAPDEWPWPWYALARAKLLLAERGHTPKEGMHQPIGESYRSAAIRSLARSLEADPGFAPAAALLAETLLPLGERNLSRETQFAIRSAAGSGAADAHLLLGRLYRNLERPDSALLAFEAYLRAGGDVGTGNLELARTLYALGEMGRARLAYAHGAASMGRAGREAYRRDLAWLASPQGLTTFDSLAADAVPGWIAAFWTNRDVTALRSPGERLIEHFRRWHHVYRHYRLPDRGDSRAMRSSMPLADGTDLPERTGHVEFSESTAGPSLAALYATSLLPAVHGAERALDDRALVYMRHGEPDATVISIGRVGGIPGGLSWRYDTGDTLIFHFKCNAYCLLVRFPVSLEGLIDLDVRYEMLAAGMRAGRPNAVHVNAMVSARTADLAEGLATDSHAPEFAHELEPLIQVFAVGDPQYATGRALVTFALPGEQLAPAALKEGGVVYAIALRLIATNAQGESRRLDTTRYFRAADTLRAGSHLFGLAELPLGPGRWEVRAVFSQPGMETGGSVGRLGVLLPRGSELAVSDLVFGRAGSGLVWQSPEGPVPLNPLDAYPRAGAVEVYYEVGGLEPEARYRTTLRIEGVSGNAEGRVEIGFEDIAAAARQAFRRTIDLERLGGGQYRLTLTIRRLEGRVEATQHRLINVLGD